MKKELILIAILLFYSPYIIFSQNKLVDYVDREDIEFLKKMAEDVMESSRIYPNQKVSEKFGPNATGGVLIRPGGRDCYPSFWIRDYAMSLDCGLVSATEQLHMLKLTAATQADQTWITRAGGMVPLGAIADHIRIDDSLPVYFPGTYSYEEQGTPQWGTFPPYSDQFFFVHMAYMYVKSTGNSSILYEQINGITLKERLERAFVVPPSHLDNHIVYTTEKLRGVDFGFRDAICLTGDLSIASVFKYRAALQMEELCNSIGEQGRAKYYKEVTEKIKSAILELFYNERGLLLASTGIGVQGDVWCTALAAYLGILEEEQLIKTSRTLAEAYKQGELSYRGNVRHILVSDDYSEETAWEKTHVKKEEYQNGSYWGTPVGWVSHTIAITDKQSAAMMVKEYIEELRENDFRKGEEYGAPYECFNKKGTRQNPVYLTTVTSPLAVFLMGK